MDLNELFPAMRCLNLTEVDTSVFGNHYSNLIEINCDAGTLKGFKEIAEKNPQLEILRVSRSSVQFLNLVIEKLPQLELFEFDIPANMKSYMKPIQFGNISHVSIKDAHKNYKSGEISFKHLKSLELLVVGIIDEKWVDFIGKNADLNTLKISTGYF